MKIQILGTGCPKCRTLAANAEEALALAGREGEVEKVEDLRDIASMGVMMTPALAVDGVVKSSGRLLSPTQIARFLE